MTVPETIPENYKLTFKAKMPKQEHENPNREWINLLDFGNLSILARRTVNWVQMFVIYNIENATKTTKVPRWQVLGHDRDLTSETEYTVQIKENVVQSSVSAETGTITYFLPSIPNKHMPQTEDNATWTNSHFGKPFSVRMGKIPEELKDKLTISDVKITTLDGQTQLYPSPSSSSTSQPDTQGEEHHNTAHGTHDDSSSSTNKDDTKKDDTKKDDTKKDDTKKDDTNKDDTKKDDTNKDDKKKDDTTIIVILVIVVVLLCIGGLFFFLMKMSDLPSTKPQNVESSNTTQPSLQEPSSS